MYGIASVVMIVLAVIVNYAINRRRFYRRGPGGLQHFNSYSSSVFTRFIEGIGKLVAFILFFLGIACFVMWLNDGPKKHQKAVEKKEIRSAVKK